MSMSTTFQGRVDVGAERARDLQGPPLLGGIHRQRVAMQQEGAVEQDRHDDGQSEDHEVRAQAELGAAQRGQPMHDGQRPQRLACGKCPAAPACRR
jgi:hypothetical protein